MQDEHPVREVTHELHVMFDPNHRGHEFMPNAQEISRRARVHDAFGALIPIGIRLGLDAKERIKADPRGLAVTYYTGEKGPCPCIADGVVLATNASPGQG